MSLVLTQVGDPPRDMIIPMDVLTDAVETLAEQFRLEGKTGDLDECIRAELPVYLEALLFRTGETFH